MTTFSCNGGKSNDLYKYRELRCLYNGAGVLSRDDCNNHPLDDDIIEVLKKLQQQIDIEDDDYKIYRYNDEIITPLCEKFIEKSIKCLYIFDNRELFKNNEAKTPYGIDNLMKYYNDITEFERILYGSSKYNHEHIIHVKNMVIWNSMPCKKYGSILTL